MVTSLVTFLGLEPFIGFGKYVLRGSTLPREGGQGYDFLACVEAWYSLLEDRNKIFYRCRVWDRVISPRRLGPR